jgi:hypothetical protein
MGFLGWSGFALGVAVNAAAASIWWIQNSIPQRAPMTQDYLKGLAACVLLGSVAGLALSGFGIARARSLTVSPTIPAIGLFLNIAPIGAAFFFEHLGLWR